MPVLVVPNDVLVLVVHGGRHISSLADVAVAVLQRVFDELSSEFGERTLTRAFVIECDFHHAMLREGVSMTHGPVGDSHQVSTTRNPNTADVSSA